MEMKYTDAAKQFQRLCVKWL